ncbi:MAG: AraC family transcriptional regulator [Acidobacteriota bacterium]
MTTYLGMLGALQGLILAAAVLSLGGADRRPNRALGGALLILSCTVFTVTGEHGGLFGDSIYPVLFEYTLAFLFPPVLWHYARTVLGQRRFSPVWIHALPAVAWLSYLGAYWVGLVTWRWLPPILALVAYLASYTVAVSLRTWGRDARATTLVSHHAVLKVLLLSMFGIHLAQLVRWSFRTIPWLADIVPLTATVALAVFSLLALRSSQLFAGREPMLAAAKYRSPTLTAERGEEVRQRLLLVLERDRPFLNENLNLADMAARLKVSRSHLSQVVNEGLGCTFSELLSRYRVRAAEKLLGDPGYGHLTIEAIGYEVGFKSRSAFHGAFKRERDQTPAQARKRMSQKMIEDSGQPSNR